MKSLNAQEIEALIREKFGDEAVLFSQHDCLQPFLVIAPQHLVNVCFFIRNDARLYFDLLECLSAVDSHPAAERFYVVYHLHSITQGHRIVLKCKAPANDSLPELPSVAQVWRTAEWHEREAFDLMGIRFSDHPDMRRILMPEDWEGHPLRKDYKDPETFHGLKIAY